jgi:glucose/arabinose dehydrogenase
MRRLLERLGLASAFVAVAATAASAQAPLRLKTERADLLVETVASGLDHPWALVFLPDGRMLVTERPGRLRIVSADGKLSPALKGVPRVYAQGQGGLLDVALDPDFGQNRLVYLTYAEPREGGAATAAGRGRLDEAGTGLESFEVIFRQQPAVSGGNHFGSRLAFARDSKLFLSTGERFKFEPAQDLGSHLGKVIRINPDGTVPPDNPFANRPNAKPEIWSYGHRNVQGLAIHPDTGALWEGEFGPMGGDEINIPEPGRNYGWPLVSWGEHYDGRPIPKPPTRPDLADAVRHWTPSISFSGIAFYTANALPGWRGNLLLAGLSSQALTRLTLDGNRVTGEERIRLGERIRHVAPGPDGFVYLLTDSPRGRILRLRPDNRGG